MSMNITGEALFIIPWLQSGQGMAKAGGIVTAVHTTKDMNIVYKDIVNRSLTLRWWHVCWSLGDWQQGLRREQGRQTQTLSPWG